MLKEELKDVKTIYFAPTAEFYNTPIEYLPYFEDVKQTMSDHFDMFRLSSTREIALANRNSGFKYASLFGGLTYNGDYDTSNREISMNENSGEVEAVMRDRFGPLSGTKVEVDIIKKYLDEMSIK